MDVPARALAVFALTYVLISGWELKLLPANRPAGALLGAVLMVVLGVLSPAQAYASVHLDTLGLLFGTMVLSEFLKESGFYGWIALRASAFRLTSRGLLTALVVVSGVLSAVLVNDTVCLMLTPFVVSMVERARLPPVPFLMALATSANIGSAWTLTGNPQNMIVGTKSGIPYLTFAAVCSLPVVVALAANLVLLRVRFRAELSAEPARFVSDVAKVDRTLLARTLVCIGLAMAGFAFADRTGIGLPWTALACAALLLMIGKRDPYRVFAGIDWTLLLFFAGLFVVIGGLVHSGILTRVEEDFVRPLLGEDAIGQNLHLTWITVVGSQIFSNVPFVLAAGHMVPNFAAPELSWVILAYVSTVAGNLTILGSVANVIVLEQARGHVKIGFLEYAKFGVWTTFVSTAAGVAILLGEHALGWI